MKCDFCEGYEKERETIKAKAQKIKDLLMPGVGSSEPELDYLDHQACLYVALDILDALKDDFGG